MDPIHLRKRRHLSSSYDGGAIKARYFDYFHVFDKDIPTMDDARKEVITACAGVDDPTVLAVSGLSEENLPPAHFDRERFAERHQRLVNFRKDIITALDGGRGFKVRDYLGRSLHTLQEFLFSLELG